METQTLPQSNNGTTLTREISDPRKGTIHAKIRAVADAVGNMQKDARNTHSNYAYLSYDSTMSTLRPYFAQQKMRVKFSEKSRTIDPTLKTQAGKPAMGALVVLYLYAIDVETGEFDVIECSNYSVDTGDKALAQANTGAKKYGLFAMFEISTSGGPNNPPANDDGDAADKNALDDARPPATQPPARRSAARQETAPLDPTRPAPQALVVNVRRIIERCQALGSPITEEAVLKRHAIGRTKLEDTNFQQANTINDILVKFEKGLRAFAESNKSAAPGEEVPT